MIRILVTAPSSNSGKTAVTCGLLALMKSRGLDTCAFKCGPDYIDPMFHRTVLDVQSHNLDVFLAGEDRLRSIYRSAVEDKEAVICEGVMGYYDGLGGRSSTASAWHVSRLLDLPAILVIRPSGSALSLAPVIKGMAGFRTPSNISGVILNDCSSSFFEKYGKLIEEESGVPVIGYLPHMEEAVFESRHLGLMTAAEIDDLRERIDRIASTMEETLDIERLIKIGSREESPGVRDQDRMEGEAVGAEAEGEAKARIAVAKDRAFCFLYEESMEALEKAGADIVYFSPLEDDKLPEGIDGLYIPGGYPEIYGRELSENISMKNQICEAVADRLPTIAECGGFLYLGQSIKDGEGREWEMAGLLPGRSESAGSLVRFGYGRIEAWDDSMLFRKGEKIPAHEFHYWDSTDNGSDLLMDKASGDSRYRFGYCTESLYAGFPHLYMAGEVDLAKRFVEAASKYGRE